MPAARSRCSTARRACVSPSREPGPSVPATPQGAERIEDDGDIDGLLEERTGDDRQEAERGRDHRDERHPHPRHDALDRDRARASGDPDRLGEAIEAIDRDDDIGGLGRCGRAPGAHRHPDVGDRQRRCVVDAVADHHERPTGECPLGADGIDLVGRRPIGEDAIEPDRGPDEFGDRVVVPRSPSRSG